MKSEYEEGKGGGGVNNSMFTKLHRQHKQLQQLHHQVVSVTRECHHQTSEEDDDESRSTGGGGPTKTIINHNPSEPTTTTTTTKGDGATIEVLRRPRGRPPGSKNKPRPPVIITRDTTDSTAMRPHVVEVSGGVDVVDALARFARRRNIGLCVLSGSGTVANVTLRQPSANPGATVTFHGHFDILSISATLLPPSSSSSIPSSANSFTISLAGPSGQIIGGSVAGSLHAASTVYVVAATFTNPSYHRLTTDQDELQSSVSGNAGQSPSASGGGGGGGGSGGGEGSHSHPAPAESCGVSIYGSHLPSDVIWAPTVRQQPPHPHF